MALTSINRAPLTAARREEILLPPKTWFVFLTLEDETGMLNVIIPPRQFEPEALLISTSPLLLVRGVLQVVDGVVNLKAQSFRALEAGSGEEHAKGRNFH